MMKMETRGQMAVKVSIKLNLKMTLEPVVSKVRARPVLLSPMFTFLRTTRVDLRVGRRCSYLARWAWGLGCTHALCKPPALGDP